MVRSEAERAREPEGDPIPSQRARSSGEQAAYPEELPHSSEAAARLAEMLRAHFAVVWRTARRLGLSPMRADEVAQDAFVTAARRLGQIEAGRERGYLLGVTVRLVANDRRLRAAQAELADERVVSEQADPGPLADELLERKQLRQLLDQAVEQLPLEQRTVFVLYELEGLSGPEIAELLALPEGTVASRLRRARSTFKKTLRRIRKSSPNLGGRS